MNLDSLKQKWHGVPVWGWALGTSVVLFLLYYLYKKRSGGSASTTSTTAADTQDNSTDPGSYGGGSGSILFPNSGTTPVEVTGSSGGVDTTGNGTSTGTDVVPDAGSPTPTVAATSSASSDSAPSLVKPQVQETSSNVGAIARGDVIAIPPPPDPVEQSLQGQHPGVKTQAKTILPPVANSNVHKPGAQI